MTKDSFGRGGMAWDGEIHNVDILHERVLFNDPKTRLTLASDFSPVLVCGA